MIEFNFTIGIMLLLLNSSIILTLVFGAFYRLKSVQDSEHKNELDINFMVLLVSLVFLFSNSFAFYTGYKYYIINGGISDPDILMARLVDRAGMLAVAILLIFIGKNISKTITEKNENK